MGTIVGIYPSLSLSYEGFTSPTIFIQVELLVPLHLRLSIRWILQEREWVRMWGKTQVTAYTTDLLIV